MPKYVFVATNPVQMTIVFHNREPIYLWDRHQVLQFIEEVMEAAKKLPDFKETGHGNAY